MVRLREQMRETEQASLRSLDTTITTAEKATPNQLLDLAAQLYHPAAHRDPIGALRATAGELAREIAELDRTTLWWVSGPMATLAAATASNLPAWTPSLVLPDPHGLLCWETPVGHVRWDGAPPEAMTTTAWGAQPPVVSWDGVWWTTRGTTLEVRLLSRLPEHRHGLATSRSTTPLMPVSDLLCDPTQVWEPRTGRPDEADVLLSVVGATWLLMGQPRVADRTTLRDAQPTRGTGPADRPPAPLPEVTLIELRREHHPPIDEPGHAGREWTRRWWVSGHWRQQAIGPGRAQRRPTWISPHVKGPDGLPLADPERVNVWRR